VITPAATDATSIAVQARTVVRKGRAKALSMRESMVYAFRGGWFRPHIQRGPSKSTLSSQFKHIPLYILARYWYPPATGEVTMKSPDSA
jgi:hypothetical protein